MAPLNLSPGTAAELLGISYQTLKYWSVELDPRVKHARYTGRELLAYRIIKSLIRERNFTPEKLAKFPMKQFFDLILSSSLEELRSKVLILNASQNELFLKPEISDVEVRDSKLTFLFLGEIMNDHFREYANR